MLGLLSLLVLPSAVSAQTNPWVSAYYAGWFWDQQGTPAAAVAAVDMTTMTHFIFGRYAPGAGSLGGSAGQLVEGAGTGHSQVEALFITKAHTNGVKALAMLGGVGDGDGFVASTTSATRATFITNILDKCVAKNYDGVDVDWEDSLDNATQQNQLIAFLTELRAAAAARPRYQPPNAPFIITFPGYAVNINLDLPIPAWKVTVASRVDQYNMMSYGMTYDCCGWDTWLWAALQGAATAHPTALDSSVQAYVDAGVPRAKIGIGLGLYASGYGAPVSGPRQPISAAYYWPDFEATWADLYSSGMLSSGYHFDTAAQTGYYTYSPPRNYRGAPVSMLITEDLESIAAKGAWTRAGNCGGTIVWTINYGYVNATVGNPPMQAIKEAFLGAASSLLRPAALSLTPLSQGVLKAGDTVQARPSWRNDGTLAVAGLTGTATASNGGTIVDGAASYGNVAAGGTVSCTASGDCYSLTVGTTRPATHWDVRLQETLAEPGSHQWLLHVGDTFSDVPRSSAYFPFVETLLHKGITGGCSTSAYCPTSAVTREQMPVFVLLAKEGAGYAPPACGTPLYSDVPASSAFCRFVEELSRRGVVSGCGSGRYCPANAVTREQISIFLLKTLDPALTPPACTTPMFTDVPASSAFCRYIEELSRRGVVSGCGGGRYCPTGTVTRDQLSVFVSTTFGLTLYGP